MYILLPPSETKTRPEEGTGLRLDTLSHPELSASRATMLRAARRTAQGPHAAAKLRVPASRPELIERMAEIEAEPAGPALGVYSGVLYDALGAARPVPGRDVLITSALLGVVDAADEIPAYRVSAGSTLSRLGTAGSWWRPRLTSTAQRIAASGRVVVDCRSGSYRSMMPVAGAHHVVPLREAADGSRSVVSHDAKRYRGLLAGALLDAGETARDLSTVLDIARDALGADLLLEVGPHEEIVMVDRARPAA